MDEFKKALAELSDEQRQELAGLLGLAVGQVFLRRYLRKHGADKVEVYAISAVVSSLALINRKLDKLIKLETPAPINVTNLFGDKR